MLARAHERLAAEKSTADAPAAAAYNRGSPAADARPRPMTRPPGRLRLGVNIDHVATVRNARGGPYPDPLRAAKLAEAAGADGITAHLREDRRHITDADIEALMAELTLPLNLEMAATDEMQAIALRHRPHAVCIVPERREERTTEGGLEVAREENRLAHFIAPLRDAGCRVSIFIAADRRQIEAAHRIGAPVIELHTGAYCEHDLAGDLAARDAEMARLREMAAFAHGLGLEVHAGHGLTFDNVGPVAALPEVRELNIGHFLVGEAIFVGLDAVDPADARGDGRGAGRGQRLSRAALAHGEARHPEGGGPRLAGMTGQLGTPGPAGRVPPVSPVEADSRRTRRLFWTLLTPETSSAMSSARRLACFEFDLAGQGHLALLDADLDVRGVDQVVVAQAVADVLADTVVRALIAARALAAVPGAAGLLAPAGLARRGPTVRRRTRRDGRDRTSSRRRKSRPPPQEAPPP